MNTTLNIKAVKKMTGKRVTDITTKTFSQIPVKLKLKHTQENEKNPS